MTRFFAKWQTWLVLVVIVAGGLGAWYLFSMQTAEQGFNGPTPTTITLVAHDAYNGSNCDHVAFNVFELDTTDMTTADIADAKVDIAQYALKDVYESGDHFSIDSEMIYYCFVNNTADASAFEQYDFYGFYPVAGVNNISLYLLPSDAGLLVMQKETLSTAFANTTERNWIAQVSMVDPFGDVSGHAGVMPFYALPLDDWFVPTFAIEFNTTAQLNFVSNLVFTTDDGSVIAASKISTTVQNNWLVFSVNSTLVGPYTTVSWRFSAGVGSAYDVSDAGFGLQLASTFNAGALLTVY
jgi:hypothetical protein